MDEYQIGKDIGSILARLDALEKKIGQGCGCGSKESAGHSPSVRIMTDAEAIGKTELKTRAVDPDELNLLMLPSACGAGEGWCQSGYCYGCCGNGWIRIMKANGLQLTCVEARQGHWYYMCGSERYFTTC